MNEITFNSALLHELRAIDFVRRLLESGRLEPEEYRCVNIHIIEARKRMRPLDASSKLNAEWAFLRHLFGIGREAATRWLDEHRDEIEQPSVLVRAQESEVRQRLAEMEAGPALRVPVGEADIEQMFREFANARAQTPPPAEG